MKRTIKFKRLVLLFFSLFFIFRLSAQKVEITGTVADRDNGDPLPGASIVIKGTISGTSTEFDGTYTLMAAPADTLVITFVGFIPQEIPVGSQRIINVQLAPETIDMGEIIVIGYGTTTKEDATGAVSVVESGDFNQGALTSADQLLSGKAAGLQITSGGGQPGSSTTIRIRGGSSLSSTNDPLIVIDGVPIATTGIDGMSNPLSMLHPEDIESFTILKDASATAIYGSRASNGVIIITTKKGKKGPIQVHYSGKVSMATPAGKIDVLNADEFRELVTERYPDNPAPVALLGDATTDWQDEILTNAFSTDHNLSVNGSLKDIVPFRLSAGYVNEDGILKTSNLERYTGTLNLSPSLLDDHLTLNVDVKAMQIKNRFAETGAVNNAVGFDPTQHIMSGDTAFGGYFTWLNSSGNPITIAPRNPVAQIELRDNTSTVNRVIAGFKADYKLHFLPDLVLTLNLGTDRSDSEGADITPMEAPWDNQEGRITKYTQQKKNDLLDLYLNYRVDIEAIKSTISATAGYSYQYFFRESFSETTDGTEQDTVNKGFPRPTDYVILSYFGRVNYTLNQKYLLTFTLRQDMTSRFSEENRAGLFPSVALAWNIKNEDFLQNVKAITSLKLRMGYGITGQQYISDDDYPYFGTYSSSEPTARYQFGDTFYTTQRPSGYNPNLKWEETTTYNIGLDFGILNNRINGDIEFYKRTSDDLINFVALPAGSNFVNAFNQNIGSLENQGVELNLNAAIISRPHLYWDIGFNASYNENEITKLTLVQDSTYIGVETGGIGGGVGNNVQIHTVGYPRNSFYVYEQVYDEDGMPLEGVYVDRNNDGEWTLADKYHYKNPAPLVFIGINSTLSYKELSLSFAGRLNLGNYVYNNIESQYADYLGLYNSVGYLGNRHRTVFDTGFENAEYWSDFFVQKASFFRMDHITLSYRFTEVINEKTSILLYGTVQNAFVITPYRGLDPERDNGIDNNVYPRPRTFTLGVKVDF